MLRVGAVMATLEAEDMVVNALINLTTILGGMGDVMAEMEW